MERKFEVLMKRVVEFEKSEARYWRDLESAVSTVGTRYLEYLETDGAGWWDEEGTLHLYVQIGNGLGASFSNASPHDLRRTERNEILFTLRMVMEQPQISMSRKIVDWPLSVRSKDGELVFDFVGTSHSVTIDPLSAKAKDFTKLFETIGTLVFLDYDPETFA